MSTDPATVEHAIDAWVAAWNESDGETRSELLRQAVNDQCVYTGPTGTVAGRAAIHAAIGEAREYMPGAVVVRLGVASGEAGEWRFAWQVRTGDGDPVLAGVDTVVLDDDGRLMKVVVLPSG